MALMSFVPDATLRRGLRGISAPRQHVRWAVVEVFVISALAFALGFWHAPQDPLFAVHGLPWSWFAPLLLALRYGVLAGLGSLVVLLAAWRLLVPGAAMADLPLNFLVGGGLLTMLCGEFSGLWHQRVRRLAEANDYLEDRVERVTRQLMISQRSHSLLEQEMLVRPINLRQLIEQLRGGGRQSLIAQPQQLLEWLAAECRLDSAQIVALDASGLPTGEVLARVGQPTSLNRNDPLVQQVRERQRLVHVQSQPDEPAPDTPHLVAAPLALPGRRAILVVSGMPFLAFQPELMQMLGVLCEAVSEPDLLAHGTSWPAVQEVLPSCPAAFAEELVLLDRIARDFALPSHVVVLTFDDLDKGGAQRRQVQALARSPDLLWSRELPDGRHQLLTLMPLAGSAAAVGYAQRVRQALQPEGETRGLGVMSLALGWSEQALIPSLQRLLQRAQSAVTGPNDRIGPAAALAG